MKLLLIVIFVTLLIITSYKINKLKNIEYKQPEILEGKRILTVY